MKTKKNNKGFSLVELIVVVAIMAVLVGVLAPAYLKYVEKSRASKDELNAEEVRHAVEVAMSDETIYDEVTTAAGAGTTVVLTVTDAASDYVAVTSPASATADLLIAEIESSCGTSFDITSKEHKATGADEYVITITVDTDELKVEGEWK